MRAIGRRVKEYGFFLFFISIFMIAIGIQQDFTIIRNVGFVFLLLMAVFSIGAVVRNVWFPPRPKPVEPAAPAVTAKTRPKTSNQPRPRDPNADRASDI